MQEEKSILKEKYGVDESKLEGEYLKLDANKPIEVEFTQGSVKQVQKPITDRKTNEKSNKWFFEIGIDTINGKSVPKEEPKSLSSTSKRLFNQLKPYLDGEESIYKKRFRIEKTGEGFETMYSVVPKADRKTESGPQAAPKPKDGPGGPDNGTRMEDG